MHTFAAKCLPSITTKYVVTLMMTTTTTMMMYKVILKVKCQSQMSPKFNSLLRFTITHISTKLHRFLISSLSFCGRQKHAHRHDRRVVQLTTTTTTTTTTTRNSLQLKVLKLWSIVKSTGVLWLLFTECIMDQARSSIWNELREFFVCAIIVWFRLYCLLFVVYYVCLVNKDSQ